MKSLAIILGLALTLSLHAADWPMHRGGPQLQGRTDMPAPAKPDLAWTFAAGNPIKGGAAIFNGRCREANDKRPAKRRPSIRWKTLELSLRWT